MKSWLKRNAILGLAGRRRSRKKVGEHESVSFHNFTLRYEYGLLKHRAVIHETVKLSVLSARIHIRRKRPQKFCVELSSRKRAVELARVNASEVRREATRNHFVGEFPRVTPPQRKNRLHVTTSKLLLPVCAHIFQAQIAKYDVRHAVGFRARHCRAHSSLVNLVCARRRNRHLD